MNEYGKQLAQVVNKAANIALELNGHTHQEQALADFTFQLANAMATPDFIVEDRHRKALLDRKRQRELYQHFLNEGSCTPDWLIKNL